MYYKAICNEHSKYSFLTNKDVSKWEYKSPCAICFFWLRLWHNQKKQFCAEGIVLCISPLKELRQLRGLIHWIIVFKQIILSSKKFQSKHRVLLNMIWNVPVFSIFYVVAKPDTELRSFIFFKLNAALNLFNKNSYKLESQRLCTFKVDFFGKAYPAIFYN